MLAEQRLRCQAEVQITDGNDFQAIVVQRDAHRTADNGIITMHERIGQCLAQCLHRQQRCVLALHAAGHDTPRDGQRFDQEAFRPAHQRKSVAIELPVVEKLVAVHALESRYLEQQLREVR